MKIKIEKEIELHLPAFLKTPANSHVKIITENLAISVYSSGEELANFQIGNPKYLSLGSAVECTESEFNEVFKAVKEKINRHE